MRCGWARGVKAPTRSALNTRRFISITVRYLAPANAMPNAARFFLVSSSFDASLALASIPRIVGRSPGKMPATHASLVSRIAALKSRALAGFIPWAIVTRAPSIVSALPARALVKPAGCSMNRNEAWVTRAEMRMMKTQCHRLLIFIVRGIALNGGLIGDQIGRRSYSKLKDRLECPIRGDGPIQQPGQIACFGRW